MNTSDNQITAVYVARDGSGNTLKCNLYPNDQFTDEPLLVCVSTPFGTSPTRTVQRKFLGVIPYTKTEYLTPPYKEGDRLIVAKYYNANERTGYTELNTTARHWSDTKPVVSESHKWIARIRDAKDTLENIGFIVKRGQVEGACVKASE